MKYLLIIFILMGSIAPAYSEVIKSHGYSTAGELKYSADFKHYEYVDPNAPKGGSAKVVSPKSSFDSFNSFAMKGVKAIGLGHIYDTLLESSADEPSSYYGLLAESIEYSDDYSYIIFYMRQNGKWHDGEPITAADVVFSFYAITEVSPFYKNYFKLVTNVEALSRYTVRFTFDKERANYEMPLIAGQLTIIPKHYWEKKDLSKSSTEIPLGSGPYKISDYVIGKNVTFEKVGDYWGKELPINKGRYNFGRITYEYFKDKTVAFEAFKTGHYDFRAEGSGQRWSKGYTGKYIDKGLIKKEEIPHRKPMGMSGIVMNTSTDFLNDINLRKALTYVYDFEWINNQIKLGQYIRHNSYYSNSKFASSGMAGTKEIEFMKSVGLKPEEYSGEFRFHKTDGKGNNREGLKKAVNLLQKSGYTYKEGKIYSPEGRQVVLEVLTASKAIEKELLPFQKGLQRIGIDFNIRYMDSTQYVRLVRLKQYMMVYSRIKQSSSPGNEQRSMWHSMSADEHGSRNYARIKDPFVDKIVDRVIKAENRDQLITAVKVLDRVLLRGYYFIPSGYTDRYRIAYWDKFGKPDKMPDYSLGFHTWWIIPDKVEEIGRQVKR